MTMEKEPMAKRHANPKFRTKEVIASDLAYILNAPLAYGTKYAAINNAAWNWTEFDGKYKGCRYWSNLATVVPAINKLREYHALMAAVADRENVPVNLRELRKLNCIHEHSVPRNVVCKVLLQLDPATPETVFDLCTRLLHGVVVTKGEDAKLRKHRLHQNTPDEFHDESGPYFRNPWLRYKRCGIEVHPVPPDWPHEFA